MPTRNTQQPAWQSKWPRGEDLKAWMRCMLAKCEAISNPAEGASKAHLPIGQLAALGETREAFAVVNRHLKRLPADEVLETVRMARLGAELALRAGDRQRAEKYLAAAEATEPFNKRKCDRGFSINAVREFRAQHGLLDPNDAVDETQRQEALFRGARRRFDEANAAGETKAAKAAIAEMEAAALLPDSEWTRQQNVLDVLERYVVLKDGAAVKRCLRRLSREERESVLDHLALVRLGMRREAIARAKLDCKQALTELRTTTNPNIHFPVMTIERRLEYLVAEGETRFAKQTLKRALREMPTWPVYELGWCTAGVYTSLAKAAAAVGEAQTAKEMLAHARADAKLEKRRGAKAGATGAALQAQADLGRLDEALAAARKLRSPTERRSRCAVLLAKARRWKELQEVLGEVASPEEAADLCWAIKFELPGGDAR